MTSTECTPDPAPTEAANIESTAALLVAECRLTMSCNHFLALSKIFMAIFGDSLVVRQRGQFCQWLLVPGVSEADLARIDSGAADRFQRSLEKSEQGPAWVAMKLFAAGCCLMPEGHLVLDRLVESVQWKRLPIEIALALIPELRLLKTFEEQNRVISIAECNFHHAHGTLARK